jgi:hypothetical protein
MVVTDRPVEDGMEMKEVIRKQPGKVGNIVVVEEAVITMMIMTIKDLQIVAAEIREVAKAEAGMGMKKDIREQPWRAGNIVRVVEGVVIMMQMMKTFKDPHAIAVEETVIMMKTITTTKRPHEVGVEEVVTTMTTKIVTKDLRVVAADVVPDTTMMITITKGLHEVVVEVREAAKAEVGMEMSKVILKPRWKAGSTAVAEEVAALTMMMTIIRDLRAVAAEVPEVGKAEDGMEMKKHIPGQHDKAGEIVIDFPDILEKVHWRYGSMYLSCSNFGCKFFARSVATMTSLGI